MLDLKRNLGRNSSHWSLVQKLSVLNDGVNSDRALKLRVLNCNGEKVSWSEKTILKGTYCLLIDLNKNQSLEIGKKGEITV